MYAAGLSWQLYSAYGGYAVALLPHLVLGRLNHSELPGVVLNHPAVAGSLASSLTHHRN